MKNKVSKLLVFLFLSLFVIWGCDFQLAFDPADNGNNDTSVSDDTTADDTTSDDTTTDDPASDEDEEPAVAIPTPEDIEGFFVQDGKLYDANGYQFQMKGVNVNHWWNATATSDGDAATIAAIPYIKASGANAARIVFGPIEDTATSWERIGMTTTLRRAAVAEYVKYKIAPVVEYHNGTGKNDPAWIDEAADFWIGEKSWLDEFGRYVMVNISNEWGQTWNGEDNVAGISWSDWAETYKAAITKMRNAGIKNLIVIDSFNYAGSAQCILDYGQELIDADPMHNIMFSIHAYGGWYSSTTTDHSVTNIENEQGARNWNADYVLGLLEEKNLTVMIGEFNKQHTLSVGGTCATDIQLIEDFNKHKTGWIFWMWENSSYDMVVGNTASFQYSAYGQVIVPYMQDSTEATVFPDTDYPALPTPEPADPNWDPGPVTVNSFQATYWLEAYIDHWTNDTPASMEIEFEDGTKYVMQYANWGNTFYTIEYNEADDLGKMVRFWVYAANGSVAKTVFSELAYKKEFAIDLE